jgi:Transposase IS116/IS110/IS902 family
VSIKDLDRSVVTPLGEYPDAEVFTSLPRSDQINAAQMLAEWGDCRQAYPQADSLAMLGGLCPVTHASGRHRDVSFPWACNKRLRQAMTTFANNSRRASPWAAEVYRQAIARGCDHPHCRADPRPRMDTSDVAMLAGPHTLRPGPTTGPPAVSKPHEVDMGDQSSGPTQIFTGQVSFIDSSWPLALRL